MTSTRVSKPIRISARSDGDLDTDQAAKIFQRPEGRHWCFSAWTERDGAVVFDRNSGDFWIVAPIASAVLHSLESQSPQTLTSLVDGVRSSLAPPRSQTLVEIVIDELVEKGLVVAGEH